VRDWLVAEKVSLVAMEATGEERCVERGRGGSMHLFNGPPDSTVATPSSVAACRWRSGWPSPTGCASGRW
jgi:hypothetical protein